MIVLAALVMSLMILSVTISIYQASTDYQQLTYDQTTEIVQNLNGDFGRALVNILANLTQSYYVLAEMNTPRYQAFELYSSWTLAAARAYEAEGVQLSFSTPSSGLIQPAGNFYGYSAPSEYVGNLTKLYWYGPQDLSAIYATYNANVTGLGFYNWHEEETYLLNMTMDASQADFMNQTKTVINGVSYPVLNVTIDKEGGAPVQDLSASNFWVEYFDVGHNAWLNATLLVQNLGGGVYSLCIAQANGQPMPDPYWKYLLVTCEDNRGIMVEGYTYTYVDVTVQENALSAYTSAKPSETYDLEMLSNGSLMWYNTILLPSGIQVPSGVVEYVPLNLTNSQSGAVAGGSQIYLNVNWASYAAFLDNPVDNYVFFNAAGYPLNSWLENGTSSSSTNSRIWLQLDSNGIAANSNYTVYLGFYSRGENVLGVNSATGWAPTLSSPYGVYDNGAHVFTFYDNFTGTSLSSAWTKVGGGTVAVNNGTTFTTTSGNGYVFIASGVLTAPLIAEAYMTSAGSSTNPILGVSTSASVSSGNKGLYNGYSIGWASPNLSLLCMTSSGATTVQSVGASFNSGIWQLNWSATTSQFGSDGLYSLKGANNVVSIANYRVYVGQAQSGLGSNAVQWVRMRSELPGGVNPSFQFGQATLPSETVPIPIPPVKQLRVNATISGPSDLGDLTSNTVLSQVEVWQPSLVTPSPYFADWQLRFNSTDKLVFFLNYSYYNSTDYTGSHEQTARIYWLTDSDASPPQFLIGITPNSGFVDISNAAYTLRLLNNASASRNIDYSVNMTFNGYNIESEFNAIGWSNSWEPLYLPGGDWNDSTPQSFIIAGPVRAVAFRSTQNDTQFSSTGGVCGTGAPETYLPNGPFFHVDMILIPYDVPYAQIYETYFWNQSLTVGSIANMITLIAGTSNCANQATDNTALRPTNWAFSVTSGTFTSGYNYGAFLTSPGWIQPSNPAGPYISLSLLGTWSAEYNNKVGEAIIGGSSFLRALGNITGGTGSYAVWNSADGYRDALWALQEPMWQGSITIPQGTMYTYTAALWVFSVNATSFANPASLSPNVYYKMFLQPSYPTIVPSP